MTPAEIVAQSAQTVQTRIPVHRVETVADVVARVSEAPAHAPFGERLIEFGAEFSRRLARKARGHSELQALAFWMRRAELVRMKSEFDGLAGDRTTLMPRGTVVHFPPANVDTIFIYSWLISLICGNRNIVRLSSRGTEQTELLISVILELAADPEFAEVVASTAMVTYPHNDAITEEISASADLRVIWGGDGSVRSIRRASLAPHATDLTFPDRVSLACLDAAAVDRLDAEQLDELASRFYNDAYWFDQLGCSSPRTIVWVGNAADAAAASARFFDALFAVTVRKGLKVEVGTAISKMTYGFSTPITHRVNSVHSRGNQILVVEDTELGQLPDGFVGAGTFHTARIDSLEELTRIVGRRYQTLSHFGFSRESLNALVAALAGRGVDRMVPIGDALTFNRFWDGYDLFLSFTRYVYVDPGNG